MAWRLLSLISVGGPTKYELPHIVPATREALERLLVEQLDWASLEQRVEMMWQLVRFYHTNAMYDLARVVLYRLIEVTEGHQERSALFFLALGQVAAADHSFEEAFTSYSKGIALGRADKFTAYFLRNDSGVCLNKLGRFREAERFCRWAIEIDSSRANAFKNLGVALEAQGDYVGAAWAWVEATKTDAKDPRALAHLQSLVAAHPTLLTEQPWIVSELHKVENANDCWDA